MNKGGVSIVVPVAKVFVVVLGGFGLVLTLLPDDDALFVAHARDGDASALVELLGRTPTMQDALTICERSGWDPSYVAGLFYFFKGDGEDVDAAVEILAENITRIPVSERVRLGKEAASVALARGEPRLAAEVYDALLSGEIDALDHENFREAIGIYRQCGEPGKALVVLEEFAARPDFVLSEELEALRVTLALESSRPGLAFESVLKKLDGVGGDLEASRDLIPQAMRYAAHSGRHREMIAPLQRFTQLMPESSLTLGELASSAQRKTIDPAFLAYTRHLAQFHAWGGEPDRAFERYAMLAAAGEEDASDLLVELNVGLMRPEDLTNTFVAALPNLDDPEGEYLILTARLCAEAGRRDEALDLFDRYFSTFGEAAPLLIEAARIEDARGKFSAALEFLNRGIPLLDGGDMEGAARELRLDLLVAMKNFEAGLQDLLWLAENTRDPGMVERLQSMAISLGDTGTLDRSVDIMLEPDAMPYAVTSFLIYAEHAKQMAEGALAEKILRSGRHHYPESRSLRMALAWIYVDMMRPSAGLETLGSRPDLNQVDEASIFIMGMHYLGRHQELAKRLSGDLEMRLPLKDEVAVILAESLSHAGQRSRARNLFQKVADGGGGAGAKSKAYYYLGDLNNARIHLIKYLQFLGKGTSFDYTLLGDICAKLGRSEEANRAYGHALVALKSHL